MPTGHNVTAAGGRATEEVELATPEASDELIVAEEDMLGSADDKVDESEEAVLVAMELLIPFTDDDALAEIEDDDASTEEISEDGETIEEEFAELLADNELDELDRLSETDDALEIELAALDKLEEELETKSNPLEEEIELAVDEESEEVVLSDGLERAGNATETVTAESLEADVAEDKALLELGMTELLVLETEKADEELL